MPMLMRDSTLPNVEGRLPALLRAYRLIAAVATPLAPLLLGHRLKRGKEEAARLAERRGEASIARPLGPLVWVHGASVGELISALPLIERLDARGFAVLVTSGTVTSASVAAQRLPRRAIHQFVPLDAPSFVRRFLDHWRPDLALFMESDLWPNLILSASARGVPLVLVNGRMSERSFRQWTRLPRTIAALLRRFRLCLAQSERDAARYSALGAQTSSIGNLKLDVPPPPADAAALAALKAAVAGRTVIAAASTHPGEEAAIIDVHRRLRADFPDLLTLVAPRHPERGVAILEASRAAGLNATLRSSGALPGPGSDIYVLDTVGELGLLYRIAPAVFIGGSLASHGGQNPIEAAKLGAAILHGPCVWNFADIYAALDAAHGAVEISDADSLSARLRVWLTDCEARGAVAQAGRKTIDGLGGALDRTLAALEPHLARLRDNRPGDA